MVWPTVGKQQHRTHAYYPPRCHALPHKAGTPPYHDNNDACATVQCEGGTGTIWRGGIVCPGTIRSSRYVRLVTDLGPSPECVGPPLAGGQSVVLRPVVVVDAGRPGPGGINPTAPVPADRVGTATDVQYYFTDQQNLLA